MSNPLMSKHQKLIGLGVLALAILLAWGASSISSNAGYSGVGPNFLPWLVAAALVVCAGWLLWEVSTGGFRNMEQPSGAERADWPAVAWVVAAIVINATLVTHIGFILSCALCFLLAVRGLRISEGRAAGDAKATLKDAAIGLAISAPVYWMFSKGLSIHLPGLTDSGWI
jgi:putative tricarboxylic transport membrane protein